MTEVVVELKRENKTTEKTILTYVNVCLWPKSVFLMSLFATGGCATPREILKEG